MEPRYRVYENAMRRCIAGLTEHAIPFAAQHLEKQIPRLRQHYRWRE